MNGTWMTHQAPTPSLTQPAMKMITITVERNKIQSHCFRVKTLRRTSQASRVRFGTERRNNLNWAAPSMNNLRVDSSQSVKAAFMAFGASSATTIKVQHISDNTARTKRSAAIEPVSAFTVDPS